MAEEYSAGTLTAELGLDASKLNAGVDEASKKLDELGEHAEHAGSSLETLKELGEAMGLEKVFELAKEAAQECITAFDNNTAAMRTMSALTGDDADKFKDLAESLSAVSRNSVATEMSAVSMASRFGLSNQAIASLMPTVQNFAASMHQQLPDAMQRFSMAVETGNASTRRLGIALSDQEKGAFKAGDQIERVGILTQALSKYAGQSAADTMTAAGAQAQMGNSSEELHSAIGALIDAPMADFFRAGNAVMADATAAIKNLSPEMKTLIGYVVSIGGSLAVAGLGFGSVYKFGAALLPILAPMGTAFLAILGPLMLVVAGVLAAATAYGVLRNAIEGKLSTSVLDALKSGLSRAVADAKGQFDGFVKSITPPPTEASKGGFNAKGGSGSGGDKKAVPVMDFAPAIKDLGDSLQSAMDNGKIDFASKEEGGTGLYDEEKGAGGSSMAPKQDRDTGAFQSAGNLDEIYNNFSNVMEGHTAHVARLDSFTQGLTGSFNSATDANADLQEQQAKSEDARLTANAQAANAAGGQWTEMLAGVSSSMTAEQKSTAMANTTPGQQVGGAIVGGLVQGAGAAGQVASGIGSAAMGNPVGLAQAGMAVLQQSKSFQKVMDIINKTIGVLAQAVDPIINAIIPALTVVLGVVTQVVTDIIKDLTPLMAPIMKLITTVMLIIQPFMKLGEEIMDVLMPLITDILTPVFDALTYALQWLAEIIIDGIVNPIIDAWDAIIDFIDEALGWLGVDLSSLKVDTVSMATNADAVDAVTSSMNQLDQSSQNIPQGFKVALSAFNATAVGSSGSSSSSSTSPGGFASPFSTSPGTENLTPSELIAATISNMLNSAKPQPQPPPPTKTGTNVTEEIKGGITMTFPNTAAGVDAAKKLGGAAWTPQPVTHSNLPSASSTAGKNMMATNNGTQNLSIQNVVVQAATPDLIGQIQNALKNQGYLKSGSNVSGLTNRFQYGSA
jgi:phage-related protein